MVTRGQLIIIVVWRQIQKMQAMAWVVFDVIIYYVTDDVMCVYLFLKQHPYNDKQS